MRWTWLIVAVFGGCVVLNPAYEDAASTSGADSGSADVTGRDRSSESDASSVGMTGAEGSGTASTTIDSSVSTNDDTAGTTETSDSETSVEFDVGLPGCSEGAQEIVDDAFLVSCGQGCADNDLNYGATASLELWGVGEETSALLMRVPETAGTVTRAEFSVFVVASEGALEAEPELTLRVIDPPCDWEPGEEDGEAIEVDTPGVTWANCDGESSNPFPWDGTVFAHVDPSWNLETVVLTPGLVEAGTLHVVDFVLTPTVVGLAGPGPHSILLTSNVPSGEGFTVLASESGNHPFIRLETDCR